MKLKLSVYILLLVASAPCPSFASKIVGLVPGRNESPFIYQHLKALSLFVDAIVYLDDASEDNSVEIVKLISKECKIEKIISKKLWYRDEPGDRNRLLQEGRAIGGTHFVVLDMDEMITSNSLVDNFMRNTILSLKPGDQLCLLWIQLWRSVEQFRIGKSPFTWNYTGFIFCDDTRCSYTSDFLHTSRVPGNLKGKSITLKQYDNDYTHGVLHFQFVNWRNLLIKQAWYRCLEHIRYPAKSIAEINAVYGESKKEQDLKVAKAPRSWLSHYTFFSPSVYDLPEQWRERQILHWFNQYGKAFFEPLDIWDIDWGAGLTKS